VDSTYVYKTKSLDNESEDGEEMDPEECPFDFKLKPESNKGKTYDEMLFQPCEDELYSEWVNNNLRGKN
jgi:hypothetical protein